MFKKKPTASEVDGVQYRRAKTWQIICYACNALVGMSVYSLIGMASYSASIGYGITTAAVGIILTCTRILNGITDPLLAFVYDRVNTKFGKLRILLIAGYLIEALALYGMFTGFSSKGLGLVAFTLLYVVYVIGYTITNMTAQTIPAIMTNDPRQRPTLGVWTTAFNYLVPMVMSMVLNVVLLPKCGGTYNQAFLTAACNVTLIVAAIGTLLVCLGVSAFDKPETFVGTKKTEPLKMADIAAQLEGTAYVTRQSVQSVPAIRKAKKAIRKAFENSMAGKGSNLVEIVSTCNSGWKMSPAKSNEWMVENMFPFYPLGDLKDK